MELEANKDRINFNEVCRTCLRPGGKKYSIFNAFLSKLDSSFHLAVVDFMKTYTKISISADDGLPTQICTGCLDETQRTYSFMLKCQRSESVLTQMKDVQITSGRKLKTVPESNTSRKEELMRISEIKVEKNDRPEATNTFKTVHKEKEKDDDLSTESEIDCQTVNDSSIFENDDAQLEEDIPLSQLVRRKYASDNENSLRLNYLKVEAEIDQNYEKDDSNSYAEEGGELRQTIKEEPELNIFTSEENIELNCQDPFRDSVKCPGCQFEYLTASNLKKHIIDRHMEGNFCKLCRLAYEGSDNLHCSTHLLDDVRPFKCTNCSEAFRSKFSLHNHMKVVHRHKKRYADDQGAYCDICWRVFVAKSSLIRHMRLHSAELKCELCSKSCRSKTVLRVHLEKCLGVEKKATKKRNPSKLTIPCEFCTKRYVYQSDLIRHIRIHTVEKPYKCEFCSIPFGWKYALTKHVRRIHKMDVADKNVDLSESKISSVESCE